MNSLVRRIGMITALLVFGMSGCAKDSGPTYYPVSGQVTFEGEPITEGSIIFTPADEPDLPAVGGVITDGQYTLKAYAGTFKVQIFANREDPSKTIATPGGEDIPGSEQYIPEQYNTKTELTADVLPDQGEQINFDL
jgi:hypothetical protein